MTVIQITFEEPDISEGPIDTITKDGVTIRFLRRAAIFRPSVATHSSPYALYNASQDINDETGFQKPIIFEFSQLQRRVRILAGLNERDISIGTDITARLVAYDSSGREVGSDSRMLPTPPPTDGSSPTTGGPSPIETPLEVRAPSDVIRRVLLEYNGNVREVIDNLEFESDTTTPIPPDTIAPIVTILQPATNGQQVNSRIVRVTGTIVEINGVTLVINGTTVPVQRSAANSYFFTAEITLPEGMSNVEAVVTDEAGNVGRDSKTLDIRIPTQFSVSDVRFTQTGLLDSAIPLPTSRVARKTSLFRIRLEIRTGDGRPTSVDNAEIVIEGGPVVQFFPGQPRPSTGNQFSWYGNLPITDGQQVYFFITGQFLEPGYSYRFILKLHIRDQLVYQQTLESNWSFQSIRGITMLLVPQHRTLDANYTRALMRVLEESARMFPVPDGITNLDSDEIGGVRFAVLPPVSYRDHMDPADPSPPGTAPIAYDQGFLLHDHDIIMDAGPDMVFGTADDGAVIPCPGEVLPINFAFPEDENRNGMFDSQELARLMAPPGGTTTPISQRMSNWSTFAREHADSVRVDWNRNHSRASRRAIAIVTSSVGNRADRTAQNRTRWEGSAGRGCPSFWASVSIGEPGFIAHETGHTFGFAFTANSHTNGLQAGSPPGTPVPSCQIPGEAINLLTRQIVNPGSALMCSGLGGGSSNLFLSTTEYNTLFNRLVSMGGQD